MSARTTDPPHPLFRRVRRTWADAPAIVQVLLLAALYFAFLSVVYSGGALTGLGDVVFRLVISVGFGTIAVVSRRLRARRWPGAPRWVDVSEATDDGALPLGADRTAWRGALDRRRREVATETGFVVIGMVVVAALFFGLSFSLDDAPGFVVFPAVLVVWAIWLVATRGRRLARIDALLVPLEQEAAEDGLRAAYTWAPPAPEDRIPPAAG